MYRRWSQNIGVITDIQIIDLTLSADVLSPSEFSIVAVLATSFSIVVASSSVLSVIFVTVASSVEVSVSVPNRTSPNSVSQACAYQSLWVLLTSGS